MVRPHLILPLLQRSFDIDEILRIIDKGHCKKVWFCNLNFAITGLRKVQPIVLANYFVQNPLHNTVLTVKLQCCTLLKCLFSAIKFDDSLAWWDLDLGSETPQVDCFLQKLWQLDRMSFLLKVVALLLTFGIPIVQAHCRLGKIERWQTLRVSFHLVADIKLVRLLIIVELLSEWMILSFMQTEWQECSSFLISCCIWIDVVLDIHFLDRPTFCL